MSIIKGLFLGLKNQKVIPFNQMTPELHNEISSGLAKIMMAAKMTKAKLTKSQREYIVNQAKQVQEFEDRYITGIKDKAGNIINKGKEKVADLFDLKGRKMDPTKSIIGGEQAGIMGIEKTSPKFIEYAIKNIKDMKNPQSVKDEINFIIKREGMYKNLTSDDAKQILEAVEPIVKKADGGRIGLKEGKGMFEELFFSKDRPILSGLNTAALFDLVVAAKDAAGPLIGLAEGGRIGYKDGPKDPKRRTFMKAAVGLASLLPFGIGRGVKMAAPAVAKAAEITGPALDKIIETVMSLGKFVSLKGKRVKEMVTKKKHEGVEVTEDVADQSYIIKKGDKEIYYKPGRQDETGGFEDDIIEVIEKRIEKAGGGGIGYMLGE
tara:strand:+ start:207 stop:1340 length:1134 start_codon:yes stop_codon:yes gene_type:complete